MAKRLHAVILNAEGRTSGELARILKAPRSRVSEWLSLSEARPESDLAKVTDGSATFARSTNPSRQVPSAVKVPPLPQTVGRAFSRREAVRQHMPSALARTYPLCCAQHNGALFASAEGSGLISRFDTPW